MAGLGSVVRLARLRVILDTSRVCWWRFLGILFCWGAV